MRSSSFTANPFLVLLFQKDKVKEKNNSRLRIETFKPRLYGSISFHETKHQDKLSYKIGDNHSGQLLKNCFTPFM